MLKEDDIIEIQLRFQTNRSSLPPIFIATPYDSTQKNSLWSKEKPNLQILCRTILLAKESLKAISSTNLNENNFDHFKVILSHRFLYFLGFCLFKTNFFQFLETISTKRECL